MAKYNYLELSLKNGEIENFSKLRNRDQEYLESGLAIYIYRGTKSKQVYIGQTKHFKTRNDQHYGENKKHFNTADFDQVIVLFSSYLNGTALDDVESQLITYF